jgi:prohibitin 1
MFGQKKGVIDKVFPEGSHFLIPGLQSVIQMDVRTAPQVLTTVSPTKDMQNVNLTLRILYRPDIRKLPTLYENLNLNYADRILPFSTEVLKTVVVV